MEYKNNPNEIELNGIFGLLNDTFRSKYSPTMQYEFGNLFRRENLKHVFFAIEGEEIAAHLAYRSVELLSSGKKYLTAFLGAVATSEKYRKRGIATTLLKMAEEKMAGENTDMCVISGELPIYRENGYSSFGKCFVYEIKKSDDGAEVEAYTGKDFSTVRRIYDGEKTRFIRSDEDFRELINTYETVKKMGEESLQISQIGRTYFSETGGFYFILRGKAGSVLEYAGDRKKLLASLEKYCAQNDKCLSLEVPESDHDFLTVLGEKGYSFSREFSMPPFHTIKTFNKLAVPEMPLPGLNFV